MPQWTNLPAPEMAKTYWKLKEEANMRDLLLVIRADEACHSHVNHTLATLPPDARNPFRKGHTGLPKNFVDLPQDINAKTGVSTGTLA